MLYMERKLTLCSVAKGTLGFVWLKLIQFPLESRMTHMQCRTAAPRAGKSLMVNDIDLQEFWQTSSCCSSILAMPQQLCCISLRPWIQILHVWGPCWPVEVLSIFPGSWCSWHCISQVKSWCVSLVHKRLIFTSVARSFRIAVIWSHVNWIQVRICSSTLHPETSRPARPAQLYTTFELETHYQRIRIQKKHRIKLNKYCIIVDFLKFLIMRWKGIVPHIF